MLLVRYHGCVLFSFSPVLNIPTHWNNGPLEAYVLVWSLSVLFSFCLFSMLIRVALLARSVRVTFSHLGVQSHSYMSLSRNMRIEQKLHLILRICSRYSQRTLVTRNKSIR